MNSNIQNQVKQSYNIHLDSQLATTYNNGTMLSNIYFMFNRILYVTPNQKFYVSINDLQIPVSFYLINSSNDTLNYVENYVNKSVLIEHGNYTGKSLASHLKPLMNIADVVYNEYNLKMTFSSAQLITILNTGTINNILGFNTSVTGTLVNSIYILTSSRPCNLCGTKNIYVNSDLPISNLTVKNSKYDNTILKCAIDVSFGDTYFYTNYQNTQVELKSQHIGGITLKLRDDSNELIDLNGIHWSLTLTILVVENDEVQSLQNTTNDILGIMPAQEKK